MVFNPSIYIHPYLDDDEDVVPSDPPIGEDAAPDPALLALPYKDYLKTMHWQEKRRRAMLRAGGVCQRCHHESRLLEVHHLTYARIGREREVDLLVVCDSC